MRIKPWYTLIRDSAPKHTLQKSSSSNADESEQRRATESRSSIGGGRCNRSSRGAGEERCQRAIRERTKRETHDEATDAAEELAAEAALEAEAATEVGAVLREEMDSTMALL